MRKRIRFNRRNREAIAGIDDLATAVAAFGCALDHRFPIGGKGNAGSLHLFINDSEGRRLLDAWGNGTFITRRTGERGRVEDVRQLAEITRLAATKEASVR